MDPQETGRHSLHVHCLRAQYLVSFLHPSPETVKARLDKTATKFLGAALGTAFSRFSSPGSPGIWLIRRLEVDWAVDAAWEPERLARGWAGQIVQTVAATLESSRDGDNVVWFASQAAYLAVSRGPGGLSGLGQVVLRGLRRPALLTPVGGPPNRALRPAVRQSERVG
jgi:hypothetical protein